MKDYFKTKTLQQAGEAFKNFCFKNNCKIKIVGDYAFTNKRKTKLIRIKKIKENKLYLYYFSKNKSKTIIINMNEI